MAHRSGTETVAALPPNVEQKLQGRGGIVGDYGPIIVREQRSVVWPSEKLIAGLNGNGVLLWFELDDFDSAVARAEVMKAVKARHRNPPSGDGGPNHWEGRSRNPQYADAWAMRGLLKLRLGQEAAAQEDFGQCLRLNPALKSSLEDLVRRERRRQVVDSGSSSSGVGITFCA